MAGERQERLDAQLIEAIKSPQFQTACIQRLVAASIGPSEALRIMSLAIARVREEARAPARPLTSRLLRALEAACTDYAEMRCLPYKKVVGSVIRGWQVLMSYAEKAGLSDEEGWAVIRDVLRKIPTARWSQVRDVDRELLEELRFGFSVIGITRGDSVACLKMKSMFQKRWEEWQRHCEQRSGSAAFPTGTSSGRSA